MASPNSSKTPQLLDDKMDDEDDSLLLDNEGNIKSAQPDPDLATDSPEKPEKTPGIRLTTENFRIVREQSDPVRTLISTRDSIRNFSDTNLRLYGQSIRPRWLGRPISPPILPGNISLPTDFHNDWRGIVQKYETKDCQSLTNPPGLPRRRDCYGSHHKPCASERFSPRNITWSKEKR